MTLWRLILQSLGCIPTTPPPTLAIVPEDPTPLHTINQYHGQGLEERKCKGESDEDDIFLLAL